MKRRSAPTTTSLPRSSPSWWEGEAIGLPSDVYAFGIVMWEVLTRQEAWHWIVGAKDFAIMNQVIGENKYCPRVPPGLQTDCRRMIQIACTTSRAGPT